MSTMQSTPETSVTNPYDEMPDWVEDYYKGSVEDSMAANDTAEELAAKYSDPNALIADYNGSDAMAEMMASTRGAMNTNTNAYEAAVGNTSAAAATANDAYGTAISGMQGLDRDLARIDTNIGSAFDTTADQDALRNMDYAGVQAGYESQYVDAMVNPVLSRMAEDNARRMAQLEASNAAIGGGTNSRTGVEMSRTWDEGQRTMAQTEADMRYQAERAGQELGLQQTAQMSDNAVAAANLGLSESELDASINERAAMLGISKAQARADIMSGAAGLAGDQFAINDTVSTRMQQQGDAALRGADHMLDASNIKFRENEIRRGIETEKKQAPLTMQNWLRAQQSTPLPAPLPQVNSTTATAPQPSLFNSLLGAGVSLGGAAIAASDERLKEDIRPLDDALSILREQRPSSYRYTDPSYDRVPEDGRRSAGLMAGDLHRIPGAVIRGADGYDRVDIYPVVATIAAAVMELDRKMEEGRYV